MNELLVLIPTRGRRGAVERVVDTIARTREAATDVVLLIDDDDQSYGGMALPPQMWTEVRPRAALTAMLNNTAAEHADRYRNFLVLGDDHVAVTAGWDVILCKGPAGITYPQGGYRTGNGETPVISTAIVRALGWLALPCVRHYQIDNAWAALGRGAGCLRSRPAVQMPHLRGFQDETFREACEHADADYRAYQRWIETGLASDVEAVKQALCVEGVNT